jgi:hypothetical protein
MLRDLQTAQDEQRKQLEMIHEGQIREHEERWESPAKYRLYNRASNRLTILRRQHSILLMQCRFTDAEAVNRILMTKMREEEAQHHTIHQREFEESFAYLREKQKAERDFLATRLDVQLAQFHRNRGMQRRIFENKGRKIEARGEIAKDSERLWNLAQLQRLEELSNVAAIRAPNAALPSSKMTPRDIKDPEVVILSLPPLNKKPLRHV